MFKRSLPFSERYTFAAVGAVGEKTFLIMDDPEMGLGVPAKSYILSVLSAFGNATFNLSLDGVNSGRSLTQGPNTTLNVGVEDYSMVSRISVTTDTIGTVVQVIAFTGEWTDEELLEYRNLISGA